jgi:replicative DNA helicase
MSIQAEQSLIGCLLIDNGSYDRISDFAGSSLIREDHRLIFRSIQKMLEAGKPVDIILLSEALESHGDLDRVGGLQYITELAMGVNTAANIRSYAKLISDAAILRKLLAASEEISVACESRQDPRDIAIVAEQKILSVLDNETERDYVHIGEAIDEAVEWEELGHKGASTGIIELDRLTNGLGKSNLIIIGARPSMGKTALALQIAEHVSKTEPAAVFSLEMSRREVAGRMLKYHTNRADRDEAVRHLYGLKMQIDDTPAVTVGHIRSRCRRIKRKHGLSLIVVDYIQLMRGEGNNRNEAVGSISRGLKSIAKEFDVPVIALSQLSRKVEERGDKRPIMSDLRESGEIEQDADLILFIYRDEVYDENSDARGTAEIWNRKNRNGPVGDCRLTFDGSVTRFGDYTGPHIHKYSKPAVSRGFTVA